jgi:hypothetical protein
VEDHDDKEDEDEGDQGGPQMDCETNKDGKVTGGLAGVGGPVEPSEDEGTPPTRYRVDWQSVLDEPHPIVVEGNNK